ncbi:tyrosine-type recombinase/integrase [Leifsonia sp. Leaf264]|uniref:tyrosine-type recombinase/integrase n=1 Tax=Leifsonia sp. Leaf264 TaxID=1736314 RepID=UPI000A999BE9|nr:tyrosine-type recombinase/integrase [Leifsonia sp. Leaf264]
MTTDLTRSEPARELEAATGSALRYLDAAIAPATRAAYAVDWAAFDSWCAAHNLMSLPAEPRTVATFLSAEADAGRAPSTITRRLAGISAIHEAAGHPKPSADPLIRRTLGGIRRTIGRPQKRARALTLGPLREVLAHLDLATVAGNRDRLLLLLGFALASRRSELAALDDTDVTLHPEDGLHVLIRRSKTDQGGIGLVKAVPRGANPLTCAACAVVRWRQIVAADPVQRAEMLATLSIGHICRQPAPITDGPLLRTVHRGGAIGGRMSGAAINGRVRTCWERAGLPLDRVSAHGLRAGFVTTALRSGSTAAQVMRQTGHRSEATVAVYARFETPLEGNAVTQIGL